MVKQKRKKGNKREHLPPSTRFREARLVARQLEGVTGRRFTVQTGKSVLMIRRDDGLEINPANRHWERLTLFYHHYDQLKDLSLTGMVEYLSGYGYEPQFDESKGVYHFKNNTGLIASIQPATGWFVKVHTTYNVPEPINCTQDTHEVAIWGALVMTDIILKDNKEWFYDQDSLS